ncbi:MAP kinase kinase (MEK), partial [Rhizina undulata]
MSDKQQEAAEKPIQKAQRNIRGLRLQTVMAEVSGSHTQAPHATEEGKAAGEEEKSVGRLGNNMKRLQLQIAPRGDPIDNKVIETDTATKNRFYDTRVRFSAQVEVHTRVELRFDDLKLLGDLGAGSEGAVHKVLHKPTNVIMARK